MNLLKLRGAGLLPPPAASLDPCDPWTSSPLGPESMAKQPGRAKYGSQAGDVLAGMDDAMDMFCLVFFGVMF